jgi:hypothetical protein
MAGIDEWPRCWATEAGSEWLAVRSAMSNAGGG